MKLRTQKLLALVILLVGIVLANCALAASSGPGARLDYQQLPLSFEHHSGGNYTAAQPGYQLSLTRAEAILSLDGQAPLRLRFLASNPRAALTGLDPLPGRTYFYRSADPRFWRAETGYQRIRYRDVYPGTDLIFYGNSSRLECDFNLAPGADVSRIRLGIEGAQRITLDRDGNIVVSSGRGSVVLGKPVVYQQLTAGRKMVDAAFHLHGTEISLTLGKYDRTLPLVVDPTVNYAAYLGRSVNDRVNAIAAAPDGSVYVAGVSPAGAASAQDEAFVAHISADGKTQLYMTYLGGGAATTGRGIALGKDGSAYITGETKAADFSVLNPMQFSCGAAANGKCAGNAFLAKLNADGSLNYATYLGGSGEDSGNAIALDSAGDVYVAGSANSIDFPLMRSAQSSAGGKGDAFIAKIAGDGSHLIYSTFLGGSAADQALGIAVDASGSAYITGQTQSVDFPAKKAFQRQCGMTPANQCAQQAFAAKLSPDGAELAWSTYLGGSGGDSGNAIVVDASGSAYVVGATSSNDFPLANPMQARRLGKTEAFAAKLLPDGSGLAYSTYLGGSGDDLASGIAVDQDGTAYISGHTTSLDFPTQAAVQPACHKDGKDVCEDAFLTVLNAKGTGLRFSSYLGGAGADQGYGIAIDGKGAAYIGGATASPDFPGATRVTRGPERNLVATASVRGAASAGASADAPNSGGIVAMVSGIKSNIQACSGTVNWTGTAGDNQWTTPGNWSTNALPGASDTVCISASGATITIGSITAAANQTISSLSSSANINFTRGPLTVTGGANFMGSLSMTAGILTLNGTNGSSVSGAMTLSDAVLTGTDTLTVTGLLTWASDGTMCTGAATAVNNCAAPSGAQGVTNANGGIAMGNVDAFLDGRTLNTSGVTTLNASELFISQGGIVNNLSGASWSLQASAEIAVQGTGGTFNNAGTFATTSGTSSSVAASFNNTGTASSNAGALSLTNVLSSTGGTWTAANTAVLNIAAANTSPITLTGGSYSGAGVVQFGSNGGNITIAGAPTATAAIEIAAGVLNIAAGTTMTVPSLTLDGAVLSGLGTMTVTGLLTWNSSGTMCTGAATGVNNCTAPTGPQGVTNANGGIAMGNVDAFLDGRTLNTNGVTTLNNSELFMSEGGIVNNLSGASWNLQSNALIVVQGTGGTFNNAGTFAKTSGTSSSVAPSFNNTGTASSNAGTLSLTNVLSSTGGTWTAASTAVLNIAAANTSPITLTGGSYTGAGVVEFGSGGGNITIAGAPTSTAAIEIGGGILNIASGTTMTVPSLTLDGAVLSGLGTMTVTGLLTWNNSGTMCTGAATGVNNCTAPTGPQGVTNANGGIAMGNVDAFLDGRTLNTSGITTLNNSELFMSEGGIVNNLSGASWNLQSNAEIVVQGTGGTFNNAGTFATGSGTSSSVAPSFNNTGTAASNAGTLSLTNVLSSTGATWTAANAAVLNIAAANTSPITLTGGSYTGAGVVEFGSGGGNITIAGAPTSTAAIEIGGGVLNIASGTTMTVPSLTLDSAVLSGLGTMTVSGLLTWNGSGTMCTGAATGVNNCTAPTGPQGVTNANGGIAMGNVDAFLDGRTLNTNGTTTLNASELFMSEGGIVNNLSSASWNLQANAEIVVQGTGGTFNNAGTFATTSGTSSSVAPSFNNTGTASSNAGTLSLTNVLSSTGGTWTAANTAVLNIAAANTSPITLTGGHYTGAGVIEFGSGGGNITIAGAPTATAAIEIAGGVLNIASGTTMTVPSLTLDSAVLSGLGTMTVTGLLTWNGSGTMCTGAATGVNNCTAPTGPQGVTNANGGIAMGNVDSFLDGRTLNTNGVTTLNNSELFMSEGGIVNNLSGASWNLQAGALIVVQGTGGTFNNAGTFAKTSGTSSSVAPSFNNTGTASSNAGTLSLTNVLSSTGGTWTSANTAVLNIAAANTSPITLTGGSYTGAGVVEFGSGGGNITIAGAPMSTAAIEIGGGVLNIASGTTMTVPTLTLDGAVLSGLGTMTVTGVLTWNNNGTMCTGAATGVNNCAAPTGPQGVTNANGGIAMGNVDAFLDGRTLNVSGITVLTNSDMFMSEGGIVNNLSGGGWNLMSNSEIVVQGTGGTFNNAGTFSMTSGTSSTVAASFNNTGTVSAGAGTLGFTGPYLQTAGTTLLNGGALSFNSSPAIQGGTVAGSGSILGNYSGAILTNPAGAIAPGASVPSPVIGAIALSGSGSGNFTTGSGAFDVKIGGTSAGQFDTLSATGAVNLASGTLNVSLVGGFTPANGNSFTIITAGAVNNKFAFTNLPALSSGLSWTVTYNPTSVVLSIGQVSAPIATLGATLITFPNTLVGQSSATMTVSLQNTGTLALTINSIVPTGADAGNYAYHVDAGKPCPISPATLAVGATCFIDVVFTPLSPGAHNNAQITITSNTGGTPGSTQQVALQGTGIVLSSIAITAPSSSILVGATEQFTATGTYSDNSTANLTSQVTWTSATPSVATISAAGLATGLVAGGSDITASLSGVTSNTFHLTVTALSPGTISAFSGSGQTAIVANQFANPLIALVRDATGNPVNGASVTFTAPANGGSVTFSNGTNTITVTTNASGQASSGTFAANNTAAPTGYNVQATTPGITGAALFSLTNTAGAAFSISATGGTPQSAQVGAAFAAQLQAQVLDQFSNPISGVTVTFNAPASGASGTFASGVNTATTDATGTATAPVFTANNIVGSYMVMAKAPGISAAAVFNLANTSGSAASLTASAGTPQSATVNAAFATQFQAIVKDGQGDPVSGIQVTFTAPGSGPSGAFPGGQITFTGTTDASGTVMAPVFTANTTAGNYQVAATAGLLSAGFNLTNLAGSPATVTANSGTPQSATVGAPFALPLQALVADSFGNPVSGAQVTFTAPSSAPSGTFASGSASFTGTTNALGLVTSTVFTADTTAGGPYSIVATVSGVNTPAQFTMTNLSAAPGTITPTAGTPQSTVILTSFVTGLQAVVKDSNGNSVSGVTVTFTAPNSGASGTFSGSTTATVVTDASGNATAPGLTANAVAGSYTVTAAAPGVATAANFVLTNLPGPPATISTIAGTPQSTFLNTPFATQFQALVQDAHNNPIPGVTVTFTPPSTGASGTFAGGVNMAVTDASGIATAPQFTANGVSGPYVVSAAVNGLAATASFALTNTAATVAAVTNVTSSAANGSYTVNASIPVMVAFSEPVTVTGTPLLSLNSGGTASYASGSGSATLTFIYIVAAGQNSPHLDVASTSALTLNGGTIKDSSGDAAALTVPAPGAQGSLGANKNIVIDTVAPTVVSYNVLFGSQSFNVIGSSRNRLPWQITGIQVVFSKPIASGDLNSLTGLVPLGFSGLGTNTLTWTINQVSEGNFATVLAGSGPDALKDAAGNALSGGAGFSQTLRVLLGDVNDDGVVNAQDLTLDNNAIGGAYNILADINGDGVNSIADVQIIRTRIGTSLP